MKIADRIRKIWMHLGAVSNKLKKLFIAIDISDDLAGCLSRWVEKLGRFEGVRLVPAENYHITAYFIGRVPDEGVQEIEDCLKQVAFRHQPFVLQPKAIVPAPPGREATMLWATFAEEADFAQLAEDLQNSLRRFGGSSREKIPHVTLLRSRRPLRGIARSSDIKEADQLCVNRIVLMESVEGQEGIYYKPLKEFFLGK